MVKKQAKTQQTTKKTTTGTRVRKKIHRTVPMGIAHVKATFNNTVVTITDLSGNIISWRQRAVVVIKDRKNHRLLLER